MLIIMEKSNDIYQCFANQIDKYYAWLIKSCVIKDWFNYRDNKQNVNVNISDVCKTTENAI